MIHTNNLEHGERLMHAINSDFSEVTMQVISRSENGILYGGVVFENYTGRGGSIEAHIAAMVPNWINRDFLWIMFDYPFKQLACRKAFVRIAAKNKHTIDFCTSMGFENVAVIGGVFPDDDMVILSLDRDGCRFLNLKPRHLKSRRTEEHG